MMSEIKASQIIQWQNEIQKKGYSDSYLRMIQNQLTSLFTHAAKIYDLPVNPLNTYGHLYPNQQRKIANLLDNENGNAVTGLGEERDEC